MFSSAIFCQQLVIGHRQDLLHLPSHRCPGVAISSIFADELSETLPLLLQRWLLLGASASGVFRNRACGAFLGIVAFLLLSIAVPLMMQRPLIMNLTKNFSRTVPSQKLSQNFQDTSRHLFLYRNQTALVSQVLGLAS